ncbi:hypothetical protein Bca52824_050975 [Brassica carinata]|uniref:DUF659 domain-containing protein n=1 Tax=Brassica carinata TaxID=52824 RepID=A0A8X7R0B2_BRACI|nr:hypothetical protein Bca52824_050975 [Brassica carinata]
MLTMPEEAPLWNYVTKLKKSGVNGGTWKFKCNICNEDRQGSYSKVRAHLLGIKNQGIVVCKKATRKKKSESGSRATLLPCENNETNPDSKKRKAADSAIVRSFGVAARDQLDQEIARIFFSGGLPFNLARNPHYHRSYRFAAENKIDGYVPPGYNKLRTTLLQKERDNVERLLVPFKSTWKERGVTIVSDGWSYPTRKPLINFIATSGSGPIFLKAVNCFGEVKDRFFISGLMKEVINEVGHQTVVQIISDNAANCKAAGEIIESTNVEKNVATYEECNWITDVHGDALAIKHFIMNHNMRLAIFSKFSPLKLLAVADTRFASIIVMLKRLKLIKRGLEAMVISEEWSAYREDDGESNFVKVKILSDDWWEQVSYIIDFTRPIYEMIRFCDTDNPCLHLVYEMWDSMIEKVKSEIYKKEKRPVVEVSPFYTVVYEILVDRWTKNNTPLHCLAHSLNPSERIKCFRRLFPSIDDHLKVMDEYQYEAEKTKMWDVGGDDFDSMEDVGYLEFASLSLDEPYMENGLIDD